MVFANVHECICVMNSKFRSEKQKNAHASFPVGMASAGFDLLHLFRSLSASLGAEPLSARFAHITGGCNWGLVCRFREPKNFSLHSSKEKLVSDLLSFCREILALPKSCIQSLPAVLSRVMESPQMWVWPQLPFGGPPPKAVGRPFPQAAALPSPPLPLPPTPLTLFAKLLERAAWLTWGRGHRGRGGEDPPSGTWGQPHIWGHLKLPALYISSGLVFSVARVSLRGHLDLP